MLFNSMNFLGIFLPITLLLYYLPMFRNVQIYVLLLASLIFYAFNHLEFLILLVISASINGVISYCAQIMKTRKEKLLFVGFGVVLNLLILSVFKYGKLLYTFFVGNDGIGTFILTLPLPIGISFYTFQGIGLLVDVWRNDHNYFNEQKLSFKEHFLNTVFFISFFPHSIAGPIVKAYTFLPQIGTKKITDIDIIGILKTLVVGFFLKTVIADNIQNYTFWIAYPYFKEAGAVQLVAMMYGYSIQIFADFAGYSLIAIGIAALFGYHLPSNFNFPYLSQTFQEFWTRWHMSLSAWLKEYLYFSLGGNKKGKIRTYINLFLVMLLGGLWHGAAWNYMAWGGVHGIMLAAERALLRTERGIIVDKYIQAHSLLKFIRWAMIFSLVSWAWLFFKLPNFSWAMEYTTSIFTNMFIAGKKLGNWPPIIFCFIYSVPIAIYHLGAKYRVTDSRMWPMLEPIVYAFLLFCIIFNGGTSDAFIYFQF